MVGRLWVVVTEQKQNRNRNREESQKRLWSRFCDYRRLRFSVDYGLSKRRKEFIVIVDLNHPLIVHSDRT